MKYLVRILLTVMLVVFAPVILLAQQAAQAVNGAAQTVPSPWAALYLPLVNFATTGLKVVAPRIPKTALPFVNLGFGIGISYLGQYLGAPLMQNTEPIITGVALGGGATMLYDAVHQAGK